MPSYVITGASRGLGYAFLVELSKINSNIVIGLVRNKAATNARLLKDGISNVTIFEADITDFAAQQKAADGVAKLTGGALDCLVNNAAMVFPKSALLNMGAFENDMDLLESELHELFEVNVVGVTKTITALLPLIKKGEGKQVITITTGMADIDIVNEFSIDFSPIYSASKGFMNVLVAEYNAVYGKQGILFLSLAPGMVDTYEGPPRSQEELAFFGPIIEKFVKYDPTFKGPITPQDSVQKMLKVMERATVEKDGGHFISQNGNKKWL